MAYKISLDRVVEMFSALAEETDSEKGGLFCRSAIEVISDWLDPSKDLESNSYTISYAAAAMAFYRFTLQSVGGSHNFKAGDITVRENMAEKVSFAEKLMNDALHDIEQFCRPKRFAFMKV